MKTEVRHIEGIETCKYIVAGAGFLGAVLAEQIASRLGEKVIVLEKRSHIGGNCYSEIDATTGIEFHKYGTHIFHTSSKKVWDYLQQFTTFTNYHHQVFATINEKTYRLPINLETINKFFNVELKPTEVADFIASKTIKYSREPENFEECALSIIGTELYKAFFEEYTIKQWQIDPKQLPASIFNRLPFRDNYDTSYFFDDRQGLPKDGYTAIFEKMLSHKNIVVHTDTDFFDIKHRISPSTTVIYSGPVDRFFDYKFGKLQWRTLQFEKEILPIKDYQGAAVMNYPQLAKPFTRIHEPKHLHAERNYATDKTLIFKEFSMIDDGSNPYYPILTKDNTERLNLYKQLAHDMPQVIIAGRLGDYKYYDMDQTIGRALLLFEERILKNNHGK